MAQSLQPEDRLVVGVLADVNRLDYFASNKKIALTVFATILVASALAFLAVLFLSLRPVEDSLFAPARQAKRHLEIGTVLATLLLGVSDLLPCPIDGLLERDRNVDVHILPPTRLRESSVLFEILVICIEGIELLVVPPVLLLAAGSGLESFLPFWLESLAGVAVAAVVLGAFGDVAQYLICMS